MNVQLISNSLMSKIFSMKFNLFDLFFNKKKTKRNENIGERDFFLSKKLQNIFSITKNLSVEEKKVIFNFISKFKTPEYGRKSLFLKTIFKAFDEIPKKVKSNRLFWEIILSSSGVKREEIPHEMKILDMLPMNKKIEYVINLFYANVEKDLLKVERDDRRKTEKEKRRKKREELERKKYERKLREKKKAYEKYLKYLENFQSF